MKFFKKKEKQVYEQKSKNITVEENENNLLFIIKILKDIEYFIFFGTLLGVVRDNRLIDGDDDVDLYVNIKDKDKLIKILRDHNIEVNLTLPMNKSGYFIQVFRKINGKTLTIDFYLYETELEKNYIIERWNLEGGTHIESKYLRIPKIFIYPIKETIFREEKIPVPAQGELICEFIYGKNWKTKLKKDEEYKIEIVNGLPRMFLVKKFLFFKRYILI